MYDDTTYAVDPQQVEGEMTTGARQNATLGELEFNTLDEPIKETIVSGLLYTPNPSLPLEDFTTINRIVALRLYS